MARKYLKGFSRLKIFPITKNTLDEYAVGEGTLIPSAQKLSKEIDSSEENIYADDEVWDTDSDVTGENVTITLAELSNELRAQLRGGTYNKETKTFVTSLILFYPYCKSSKIINNDENDDYENYRYFIISNPSAMLLYGFSFVINS